MRFSRSEGTVTLTTQSECFLASTPVFELPQPGRPYGENRIFMEAAAEDQSMAQRLSVLGRMLYQLTWGAFQSSDVYIAGRRPNSLDNFSPLVIEGEGVKTLANTALLLALQKEPRLPSDEAERAARINRRIGGAQLLSAWLLGQGMLDSRAEPSLLQRFAARYEDWTSGYKHAAGRAAKAHLAATRHEFRQAAPSYSPGALYDLGIAAAASAYQQYCADNPDIVRLADLGRGEF